MALAASRLLAALPPSALGGQGLEGAAASGQGSNGWRTDGPAQQSASTVDSVQRVSYSVVRHLGSSVCLDARLQPGVFRGQFRSSP